MRVKNIRRHVLSLFFPLPFQLWPKHFQQGVQKVTSIEGVNEYAFPNGLHVLLFPDNSKPKITVNVVYLVGSRNEGYGETGMAHLLEHMVFKTYQVRPRALQGSDRPQRAAISTAPRPTTRPCTSKRSTPATTICVGLSSLKSDRMVNMTMLKKDLDSEMTVVRNEMESGENSPMNVLHRARAWPRHITSTTTAKSVIGNRTDVERVPIANLAAFYGKYYQPDNADLIIAGQFDESKALAMVAETIGSIARPAARTHAAVHSGAHAGRRALRDCCAAWEMFRASSRFITFLQPSS